MVIHLNEKDFTKVVTDFTQLADTVYRWNIDKTEEVSVSRPLTKLELCWIKWQLPPITEVRGVRFAPDMKDVEGSIFKAEDGQIMIAAKVAPFPDVRPRADHWSYSISDYLMWLIAFNVYTPEHAFQMINMVKGKLEDLLHEGIERATPLHDEG